MWSNVNKLTERKSPPIVAEETGFQLTLPYVYWEDILGGQARMSAAFHNQHHQNQPELSPRRTRWADLSSMKALKNKLEKNNNYTLYSMLCLFPPNIKGNWFDPNVQTLHTTLSSHQSRAKAHQSFRKKKTDQKVQRKRSVSTESTNTGCS